jgi:hypothetical protein
MDVPLNLAIQLQHQFVGVLVECVLLCCLHLELYIGTNLSG